MKASHQSYDLAFIYQGRNQIIFMQMVACVIPLIVPLI